MQVDLTFAHKLNLAKGAVQGRLDDMSEESIAYMNILPCYDPRNGKVVTEMEQYVDQNQYFPPDYQVTVDRYANSLLESVPVIEFQTNGVDFTEDDVTILNNEIERFYTADDLNSKMTDALRIGLRKGICAMELISTSRDVSGKMWREGVQIDRPIVEEKGHMDLIVYPPQRTFIDPNADPTRPRETAAYVIVELGTFSEDVFKVMAEKNKWNIDYEIVKPEFTVNLNMEYVKNMQGVQSQEGYAVSKIFYQDGMVDVIINNKYSMGKKLNSKLVNRMPLIIYQSIGGGDTVYGRMLWMLMRDPIIAKCMTLSLSLDAVGKNLAAPVMTTESALAGLNVNEIGRDSFFKVKGSHDRPLANNFHQLSYREMTPASQMIMDSFNLDIQKISRLNEMETAGVQGQQQIRTDGIAAQMSGAAISQRSDFLRMAEYTFFKPLGEDILDIFRSFYEDYGNIKAVSSEKLFNTKAIRVMQGSSLEEDKTSRVEKFAWFLQTIVNIADDSFDVDKVLSKLIVEMGITPNAENYKLNSEEIAMKQMVQGGVPADEAYSKATGGDEGA